MFVHKMVGMLLLLVCVGCGSGELASVSGTVTFAGEEIPDGALRFFPLEGTPGKGAGAEIKEGRYEITEEIAKEKGMMAGKYRISLTASRKTGRKIRSPEDGKVIDQILMYIPKQYNFESGLVVELDPGPNQRDLTLDP